MSKKTIEKKNEVSDTLATDIADALNTEYKKTLGHVAYVGGVENPSDIADWISTSSDILDLAISNRKNGGVPVGRIIEIQGLEASGKSLLTAHILAETQKKGGVAVYYDTESATSRDFFTTIGIDMDKMLYIPMNKIEDIFDSIERIIDMVRKSDNKKLVTIAIDSIMGATTKIEDAATYEKDGYATSKAILLSKAMRKITHLIAKERICLILTNQLRVALGVTWGDSYVTSGGKAIAFHSSVRLRLKSKGKIKIKGDFTETICGIKTEIKIIKNRLGPPHRAVTCDIYFESGLDNYGSWLETMKTFKLVAQSGAWYAYNDMKFLSKDFSTLLKNNPKLKREIYDKIAEHYIMKYKPSEDFGIDDIDITSDLEIADEKEV